MNIDFSCPECGDDLEIEVVIESAGYPGRTGGLPEHSYPGEGAEWYVDMDKVKCDGCGKEYTQKELNENEKLGQLVQERASEPPDDDYDWDDRDDDE